jgi:hypothetical protein
MKQKLLILFLFTAIYSVKSQDLSLSVGTNFTKFDLKNPESFTITPLQSGSGSFFELNYSIPSTVQKLQYTLGFGVNEYNALAGNLANSYSWQTKYLGLRTGFQYDLITFKKLKIVPQLGMNFSTLIYGKQQINGAVYDLKSNNEFSGLKLIPYLGFTAKYKINDLAFASIGYNYSVSFKPELTSQEYLTFSTNQIVLGLHFNVNN